MDQKRSKKSSTRKESSRPKGKDRSESRQKKSLEMEKPYILETEQIKEENSYLETSRDIDSGPKLINNNMNQRQTYRQTINQYLPRSSSRKIPARMTQRPTVTNQRQTVDEDDDLHLDEGEGDELNADEYEDIVRNTLNDDQTNLLFKNILKKDGFSSFGARDSVLSGRNSYNAKGGRFSSKYGDNRLYLQRLSRHSIDSSQGLQKKDDEGSNQQYKMKIRPKPRKYNPEDLDESYFAAKSNEDGNCSREENPAAEKSDFFNTQKREFKILDKKNGQKNYASNQILSSSYTRANFIPLNLVQQFSKRSNLYFLVVMVMQMIPSISITGGQPTILLGLLPIIVISIIIDYFENAKKQSQDFAENTMRTQRIEQKEHGFIDDTWENLKVGMVVKVTENQRFPADLILLKSSNPNGIAYVETLTLDGETNLKHKSAIRDMQDAILSPSDASTINGHIYCDYPNDFLYNFDGLMTIKVKNSQQSYKYALDYNQLLLRGSSLKTTHWIYGIVVYTGKEAKCKMHDQTQEAPKKASRMQKMMDTFILYLLFIQIGLAMVFAEFGVEFDTISAKEMWYLQPEKQVPIFYAQMFPAFLYLIKFGNWFLVLMNFIPISLVLTVDVIKIIQGMLVEWDVQMISLSKAVETTVHQSTLSEELGQVSYILSDKTGTITRNQMIFRKMSINGVSYGNNDEDCEDDEEKEVTNFNMVDEELDKAIKFQINPQYEQIQRFLYHLALCHSVLTCANPKEEQIKPILSSSSPDELALVMAAKYYGIKFVERNQYNEIIIENDFHQQSQLYKFKLLNVIEYNSDRKRMTVIVEAPHGEIKVLCKGADSVLTPLLADSWENQEIKANTMEHLYEYANDGLRTLMICERTISQSFYRSWVYKYEQAKTAINHKQLKILNVVSEIERDFNLLGATAVEDQLQDKAPETIAAIKQAGIKFWMLTGDKLETAVNIGFSCKVLDQGTQIFRIEQQSKQDIMNYLTMVLKNIQKSERKRKQAMKEGASYPEYATILSGESFFKIQGSERLLDCFMELALTSRVLIACRLSPSQKADVIRLIKEYQPKKITLAIGDGINDIAMMNQANIAISIKNNPDQIGVEGGNHALSQSDYAIGQFKQLKPLLFYHGRESYRKNSYIIFYMIYKNLLFLAPAAIFGLYSGFQGQNLYGDWMMQLFNIVFTAIPIVIYGVSDQEFDKETLIRNPKLYQHGPNNFLFRNKLLWQWLTYTFMQSALIFYSCFTCMKNANEVFGAQFVKINSGKSSDLYLIGTLLYGSIVLISNLKLLQDSHSYNLLTILASIFSIFSYFGIFYAFSMDKNNDLFRHFDLITHFPQYMLCISFFALGMWPINQFYFFNIFTTRNEEIMEKTKKDKHKKESDAQDLEDRQNILKDQQRESMRGSITSASLGRYTQHTGFAFSGEEGHVPQIIENLKSYQ